METTSNNAGMEKAQEPELNNQAIFKGIIDTYGFDAVVNILALREQVLKRHQNAQVVDITEDSNTQMTVYSDHVSFVSGKWHGELAYDEARTVVNEVIDEALKTSDYPE